MSHSSLDNLLVIYAFDPGGTTGVAAMEVGLECHFGPLLTTCIRDLKGFVSLEAGLRTRLKTGAIKPENVILIFERFKLRPEARMEMTWNDFPSAEKAGIILYIAHKLHIAVVEQSPSIMGQWPDRVLRKELPIPLPNTEHEKDALRHLLHWWFTQGGRHYYAK